MKNKNLELTYKIAIVIAILYMLVCHIFMKFTGDDGTFLEAWSWENFNPVKWALDRYDYWTSRTFIELILIFAIRYFSLWKIADIVVFYIVIRLLSKVCDENNEQKIFGVFLMLCFPFLDMGSAGWITTSINYFWIIACDLFVLWIVKKAVMNEKISLWQFVFSIPLIIWGSNHEQSCVFLFVILVFSVIYKLYEKRYKCIYLYTMLAINIISLCYILNCEGNKVRSIHEAESRGINFETFSVIEKALLGLNNIENLFVANPHVIVFPVCFILTYLVYKKTKNIRMVLISSTPLCITMGYMVWAKAVVIGGSFFRTPKQSFEIKDNGIGEICIIAWFLIFFAGIGYSIYVLLNENIKKLIFCYIVMVAGVVSAEVMGFSPSIYVSGSRTMVFFDFSIMITAYICLASSAKYLKMELMEKRILTSLGIIWCGMNMLNVFVHILRQ